MGKVQDVPYEILNVLEFNRWVRSSDLCIVCYLMPDDANVDCKFWWEFSTRKRQSVVCRYPDGRLVLYCKVIIFMCLFRWMGNFGTKKNDTWTEPVFCRVLILWYMKDWPAETMILEKQPGSSWNNLEQRDCVPFAWPTEILVLTLMKIGMRNLFRPNPLFATVRGNWTRYY